MGGRSSDPHIKIGVDRFRLDGERLSLADLGGFLTAATVGSAVGGAVFVALLKYSHVVRSGPAADRVDIEQRHR